MTNHSENLPALIDRASHALSSAKTSAEVLEARDAASVAYDAAKSAGRMARAKKAHDDVLSAVYRAQADALLIEARAKVRLADEYDAAQERGDVAVAGDNQVVPDGNDRKATASDIGITRKQIHDARKLRDAEADNPGKTERALVAMVERGEEPTKAKLRREIEGEPTELKRPKSPYADLTREALEDDHAALHEAYADLQKQIAVRDDAITRLKEQVKDLSSSDKGAIISKLDKQRMVLKGRLDDAMTATKREEYKRKKSEARVAELEAQEIAL